MYNPTDDTYPHEYELSKPWTARHLPLVERLSVLPAAFLHIPLAPHNRKLWHAGLMAIASVAEGADKVM